jgi:hypothetical protein
MADEHSRKFCGSGASTGEKVHSTEELPTNKALGRRSAASMHSKYTRLTDLMEQVNKKMASIQETD